MRIGKKVERRLRPKELVKALLAAQRRPQRHTIQAFLERLYRAYSTILGQDWRTHEPGRAGRAVSLIEVHDLLTLMLSSSEYPVEEFGRDLLLLDRQPDLRTRDGSRFELPGSTLSKGKMKPVTIYDEQGSERTYIAIRFVKES